MERTGVLGSTAWGEREGEVDEISEVAYLSSLHHQWFAWQSVSHYVGHKVQ
jgi:hypothetical protein